MASVDVLRVGPHAPPTKQGRCRCVLYAASMIQPSRSPAEAGVLAGVKVVEFSQNAAVPQCGRLLAGMGADVVKVEPLEGDSMRHIAKLAPTESRAFTTINPGKRGIQVDLTAPRAPEVVDRLLVWADVCLVGLKAPDLDRFGLGWEHAHQLNPALVQLVLTAFGPAGPDADQGGYDVLVQGLSGLGFSMNRSVDGVPMPTRPAFIDFSAGAVAALGVVAALRHRDRTGIGQRVDASLLGAAMTLGTPVLASFERDEATMQALGEELNLLRSSGADFDTQRHHYESRVIAGSGVFRIYFRHYLTIDGLISVAGMSPALIERFHEITQLSWPPSSDPTTPEFQAIVDEAEALFATRSTSEWIERLREGGYPCTRYNLPFDAVADPQVVANDYVVTMEHPTFGEFTTVGMPFAFDATPTGVQHRSPRLGEHTLEVLTEIGLGRGRVGRATRRSGRPGPRG